MRLLSGEEAEIATNYIDEAAEAASSSVCLRAHCGSIIVNGSEVLGRGFNSPPGNEALEKCLKDELPNDFKSDKTCCMHAEQRAIVNALIAGSSKLRGSTLYFVRLDMQGNRESEEPSCTICSKLALEVGVKDFVVWHRDGIRSYDTHEYNEVSFGRKV